MLDRPDADRLMGYAASLICLWNEEADRFRRAAQRSTAEERPTYPLLNSARDMRREIERLLDEIDAMIDMLPASDPHLTPLLRARIAATALADSIGISLLALEAHPATYLRVPHRVLHAPVAVGQS